MKHEQKHCFQEVKFLVYIQIYIYILRVVAGGGNLCGVCVTYDKILCAQHQALTCGKSNGGYGLYGQCGKWTTV